MINGPAVNQTGVEKVPLYKNFDRRDQEAYEHYGSTSTTLLEDGTQYNNESRRNS